MWGLLGPDPTPSTKERIAPRDPNAYPTTDDAEFARKYDYAYGQSWEPFFNNATAVVIGQDTKGGFKPSEAMGASTGDVKSIFVSEPSKNVDLTLAKNAEIKEELKDVFARAALATNRSGLATLGFAPSRTMMDIVTKKDTAYIAGAYDRPHEADKSEKGPHTTEKQSNVLYSNLAVHDAIVHESIHRGIQLLRERQPEAVKDLFDKMNNVSEEYVVRYLMQTRMGNPEAGTGEGADEQLKTAKVLFAGYKTEERREALEQLDALAAEEYAKKRPGGPR